MVQAVRLALGTASEHDVVAADWALILDRARAERLAALAWHASGALIQASAPDVITTQWRRTAQAARLIAHLQLELVRDAQARAAEAGVAALGVKGVGLAERAHGAWWVRPSSDIDLWAAPTARSALAAVLEQIGWRRQDGMAPGEETFVRVVAGTTAYLEVHSVLLHRALAYLNPPPPVAETLLIDDQPFDFAGGPLLPSTLAAHLAQHWFAPLLWDLDLYGLWRHMTADQRAAAEQAARDARMGRYLDWAQARIARVERLAEGDETALDAFGFTGAGRREGHPWWRIVRLASNPLDAMRTTRDWMLPPEMRASPRVFLQRTARRISRLAAYARTDRPDKVTASGDVPDDGGSTTSLRPAAGELIELVRTSMSAGTGIWIGARGASMSPTIPAGAEVLVAPLRAGVRPGQVVFAVLGTSTPVVHRVERVDGDRVLLRGDARVVADPPVGRAQILGEVTRARRDGREWVVAWSAEVAVRVAWHRLKGTVRRTLGAAR